MTPIARRVNVRLAQLGWSHLQLARRLGKSRQALWRSLDGNPRVETLRGIAKALGVDLAWLVGGEQCARTYESAGRPASEQATPR
jgi:transcriptional regulator with XRE-family HTH domain